MTLIRVKKERKKNVFFHWCGQCNQQANDTTVVLTAMLMLIRLLTAMLKLICLFAYRLASIPAQEESNTIDCWLARPAE